MPFNFDAIKGIQVVLETQSRNLLVGILKSIDSQFVFEYDWAYLHHPKAIPLGPEMPLTRKEYRSTKLFRPFLERIPPKENPAYVEYCESANISVHEENPLILLATIAARGPSSFLFKPIYDTPFTGADLKSFRNQLGLSVREFALCFDFSPPGITRVETAKTGGREILKRSEIYARYPEVALDQLRRRGAYLHRKKLEQVKKRLQNP